ARKKPSRFVNFRRPTAGMYDTFYFCVDISAPTIWATKLLRESIGYGSTASTIWPSWDCERDDPARSQLDRSATPCITGGNRRGEVGGRAESSRTVRHTQRSRCRDCSLRRHAARVSPRRDSLRRSLRWYWQLLFGSAHGVRSRADRERSRY